MRAIPGLDGPGPHSGSTLYRYVLAVFRQRQANRRTVRERVRGGRGRGRRHAPPRVLMAGAASPGSLTALQESKCVCLCSAPQLRESVSPQSVSQFRCRGRCRCLSTSLRRIVPSAVVPAGPFRSLVSPGVSALAAATTPHAHAHASARRAHVLAIVNQPCRRARVRVGSMHGRCQNHGPNVQPQPHFSTSTSTTTTTAIPGTVTIRHCFRNHLSNARSPILASACRNGLPPMPR